MIISICNDHKVLWGDLVGYSIDYDNVIDKKRGRLPVFTVLCFLAFLLLVNARWPEGAAFVRSVFLAAKESFAVAALEDFAKNLAAGEGAVQAFSDFFHTLLA